MIQADDWSAILLRLGVATLIGLALGLERQWSGHDAGLRTHAIVSLSSAMLTVSSLLLFVEIRNLGGHGDPLRVVQGLAQAIGFIAGGLIFISRRTVRNMTTAASLWMAAAIGIGAGAGQFLLVLIGAALTIVLLLFERLVRRWLPSHIHADHDELTALPSRRGTTHNP
jgi:putative Mg2+ transporter-C (MgtC) family protein